MSSAIDITIIPASSTPSQPQCVSALTITFMPITDEMSRHGQGDRRDDREPLGRDGHLRVRARLVELDHALQVLPLTVGHRRDPAELVLRVAQELGVVGIPTHRGCTSGRTPRGPAPTSSWPPAARGGGRKSASRKSSVLPVCPEVTRPLQPPHLLGDGRRGTPRSRRRQCRDERVRQLGGAVTVCSRPASMRRTTAASRSPRRTGSTPEFPRGPCTVTSQFGADELVELNVMHVPVGAGLRRMEDDEHVVGVDVDLGKGRCVPHTRAPPPRAGRAA